MSPSTWARMALAAGLAGAFAGGVAAVPYVPRDDAVVLEQLPEKGDPALADLKRRRVLLARAPRDERMAQAFARRAIAAARQSGDPRFLGQAQAALAPWWASVDAPPPILLLRATIKQSRHDFTGALLDLDRLLAVRPDDAQGRLTRATVLTVQGSLAKARADCRGLEGRVAEVVAAACLAAATRAAGSTVAASQRLAAAIDAAGGAEAPVRTWAQTMAAEIAADLGDDATAEQRFRAALSDDPSDAYARAAWADFLLERGRHDEVVALLATETRNDGLLLRLVLAERDLPSRAAQFEAHRAELAARYAAATLRGDELHAREMARFALEVEGDADRALALAVRNFAVQKEPADVAILIAAARAADDRATLALAGRWIAAQRASDRAAAGVGGPRS